ncbi:MAG: hypothetical protein JXA66_02525 [Oligoflexia bacterium]|nr:hypothetical protein [Oligoflexia bacterium]
MDITSGAFLKGLFLNYLPDIVFINLVLVCVLFVIFSFVRLLRRRKRFVDDTVPYMTFLKESLDELIKEAEDLRKELSKAKSGAMGSDDGASAQEITRLQAMIDEKNEEIGKLKQEIVKYENQEPVVSQSGGDPAVEEKLNSKIRALEENIKKLEKENKDLAEEVEKAASTATGSAQDSGKIAELGKANKELSEKIEKLESQLLEYEIIEDDLANLKVLKEENEKLKIQLGAMSAGVSIESQPSPEQEITSTLNQLDEVLKEESVEQVSDSDKEVIVREAEEKVQEIVNEGPEEGAKDEIDLGNVPEGIDEDMLREFGITGSDLTGELNIEQQNIESFESEEQLPVTEPETEPEIETEAEPATGPEREIVTEAGEEKKAVSVAGETDSREGELEGKLAEEFEQFMSENQ